MNKKFIEQIPSYLKEFNISNDEVKKQQKWIEQKIMLSFQNSLNQLMQEKVAQESNTSTTNDDLQATNSSSQFRNKGSKDFKSSNYNVQQNFSQNLIDIQLIKSQMKINQREYPKLFPAQSQIEKVKGDQALKMISQNSYIRHNISTQSTNIPPTSINNRHSKNEECLTLHAVDDETTGVSAFSVNPSSTNSINNNSLYQNKQKRNVQHKKSHSNATRELSYAEQQKKKKLFYMNNTNNNNNNNTNINNSLQGQNLQNNSMNNSFSYQNNGNQSFSYNTNYINSNNNSYNNQINHSNIPNHLNINRKSIYDMNLSLPLN